MAGPGPSARYAHTLALVANRFLVAVGGNDGKQTLADSWALDTSEKPYQAGAGQLTHDGKQAELHPAMRTLSCEWLNAVGAACADPLLCPSAPCVPTVAQNSGER